MRTIVYIDGYNLYYGRIANTPYKWLDLPTLFGGIVHAQDPSSVLCHVKFFTASAIAKFSRRGQASQNAQTTYHRALETKYPDSFTKILGQHSFSKVFVPKVVEGKPDPSKDDTVLTWKIVEKKTDVNLAIAMYRDACKGLVDQIVLCSNDSDAEPALEAIRTDFPHIRIGVVTPRRPPLKSEMDTPTPRVKSKSLAAYAHWVRSHITDAEMENAQLLQNVVAPSGKVFKKPPHWFPSAPETDV